MREPYVAAPALDTVGVALTPIIEKRVVDLEAFRGRTIAVDGNLELYQFLSVIRLRDGSPLKDSQGRVTSHLNGLMFRTTRLMADYDIRPIFAFDGTPPALKAKEIEKRKAAREKAAKDYELALKGGDYGTAWSKAVMTSRLTREMVTEAKTLLGHLGIPHVQAPSEGEAQAASLAQTGIAWAAGSKDYDSLLFGAPRLVRFLTISGTEWLPSQGRSRPVRPARVLAARTGHQPRPAHRRRDPRRHRLQRGDSRRRAEDGDQATPSSGFAGGFVGGT